MIPSLATLLLGIALFMPAAAQPVVEWRAMRWSESFTGAPSLPYHLGTDTRFDLAAGHAVLTPAETGRAGRLFLRDLLPINYFDLSFRGWFGGSTAQNDGGADGIVFVFGPLYDYGESGGGTINFDGSLGYGVEFDTYQNPERSDRSPEHVALVKDESANHLVSEILTPGTLENNAWHDLRVRFRAGVVEVFIDGTRRLDYDIADFTAFDGFFGFAAATGFAYNEHRVDDIALSLPTRGVTDFGAVNICEVAVIDTALLLRNNHPDAVPLGITAITLTGAEPGVFTLAANPAPAVIAPNGVLRIPLRIEPGAAGPPAAGTFAAVLRVDAANGETMFDTLRIVAAEPVLSWNPRALVFPGTWVGDTAVATVTLRNSGVVPATIDGLQWMHGANSVFAAALPLPLRLAPGDSIAVQFRFMPTSITIYSDSLTLRTSCGERAAFGTHGSGKNGNYRFGIGTPMVLSPGETDRLVVYVDSMPDRWSAESFDFELEFDRDYLAFDGVELVPGGTRPGASLGQPWVVFGSARFTLDAPGGLPDTGAVLAIRLTALARGPECRPVRLDWTTRVPYFNNGHTEGDVCINPSCRHPDGLRRTQIPTLAVSPHPAHDVLRVEIHSEDATNVTLRLYDAGGRGIGTFFDGMVDERGALVSIAVDVLSNGYYYLHLRSPAGERTLPVIVEK